jgi:kynurenine formamidase
MERIRMNVVDLTHPIRPGMQVYPGDPEVRIEPAATVEHDGVAVAALHLGSHTGTHLDAPLHSVAGGEPIDTVDVRRLFGPARVVDATGMAPRQPITLEAVRDRIAAVEPGEIVLFRTDWSQWFGTAHYLAHPFLHADVARALLDAGVRVLGVDALNPDRTPEGDEGANLHLPVHDAFLGAGGLILENLTNLADVQWQRPWLVALPLRIAGGDGSPVRAVAVDGAGFLDR